MSGTEYHALSDGATASSSDENKKQHGDRAPPPPPSWGQIASVSHANAVANGTFTVNNLPHVLATPISPSVSSPTTPANNSANNNKPPPHLSQPSHSRASSDFRFSVSSSPLTMVRQPSSPALLLPSGQSSSPGGRRLTLAHQASRRTLRMLGGHSDHLSESSESSSSSSSEEEENAVESASHARNSANLNSSRSRAPSSAVIDNSYSRKSSRATDVIPPPPLHSRKTSRAPMTPAVAEEDEEENEADANATLRRKSTAFNIKVHDNEDGDSSTSDEEEEDHIINRWSTLVNMDREEAEREAAIAAGQTVAMLNEGLATPERALSNTSSIMSTPAAVESHETPNPGAYSNTGSFDRTRLFSRAKSVSRASSTGATSPLRKRSTAAVSARKASIGDQESLEPSTVESTSDINNNVDEPSFSFEAEPPRSAKKSRGGGSGNRIKWKTISRRIPYYIPCLNWMRSYNAKESLLGDFIAGLSVGVMLVPQGLTYATLANLPPIYGLYAAFFPLIIYSLMGSSRHLSIGPEVTSSILIGKTISNLPNIPPGDISLPEVSEALVSAALALSFLIGVAALLLGLFRLGFLDSILSKPILAGFVLAVAATLVCEQLPVLLGLNDCGETCKPGSLPLEILLYSLEHLKDAHWITSIVSVACCSFMIFFSWLKKRFSSNRVLTVVPDVLVVVVVATAISYFTKLPDHGVKVLGALESGFKPPAMPNLDQGSPSALLQGAFMIALLGFTETQLINKKYGSKYQYTVSPNRELVALGCCSFISSFFGSYSAFGSIPRSKVCESAGQKTQAGNLIAACVSFSVILWLLPLFHYMPKCVTSSIIFVVASSLIETEEIVFIYRVKQWMDLFLLIAMFLATFLLGVDIGVAFAFASCLLLAVKQTTLPGVTMLGRGFSNDDFHDLGDLEEEVNHIEGILIYKVEGSLYFANAEKMKESCARADIYGGFHVHPSEEPHPMAITAVVFDLSGLSSVDSSALMILLEIVQSYRRRNAQVIFVKLRRPLRPMFEASGILELMGRENLYKSIERAVEAIQQANLQNLKSISEEEILFHQQQNGINNLAVETIDGLHANGVGTAVESAPQHSLNGTNVSNLSIDTAPEDGAAAGTSTGVAISGAATTTSASNSNATSPGLMSQTPPFGLLSMPSFRRKKSSFFAPPIVGSPLLRGLTKMKM